jgi:hypothetical protein
MVTIKMNVPARVPPCTVLCARVRWWKKINRTVRMPNRTGMIIAPYFCAWSAAS